MLPNGYSARLRPLNVERTPGAPAPSAPMTAPDHPAYRADIDGLRAVAVISVVMFHADPDGLRGGFVGVDIFFVISGFLISSIIAGGLAQGSFSYREFYERRVRRIFPALMLVLAACLAAGWFVLLAADYRALGWQTLGGAGFLSNFLLWREAGYFDNASEYKPLLHLWSLAIEEQFYIAWPLVLALAWRWRWNPLATVGGLAVLSFLANVLNVTEHPSATFFAPWSRAWELMAGGWLALAMRHHPEWFARGQAWRSAIGALLLLVAITATTRQKAFPGWWALLPVLGAALLISAGPQAPFNRRVLAHRVAVWFGKISYPLYLWHWPLLAVALTANHYTPLPSAARWGLMIVAVLLAWLTLRFVETPIRRAPHRPVTPLLAGYAAIAALAAGVVVAAGLPGRAVHGDETRVFLDHYAKLHKFGLAGPYEARCDFYDWDTGGQKPAIDPACTDVRPGRPAYLLWGDSHAQALLPGMRRVMSPDVDLAVVATSGCAPSLDDSRANGTCRAGNATAREFIARERPQRVIIAQREKHEQTDWQAIAGFVQSHGGELVLVGPTPQWQPSLPIIVARDLKATPDRVAEGVDAVVMNTDRLMRERLANSPVQYVSLVAALCDGQGCRARIRDEAGAPDLLVLDYGHLTPAGSALVAREILAPWLAAPR